MNNENTRQKLMEVFRGARGWAEQAGRPNAFEEEFWLAHWLLDNPGAELGALVKGISRKTGQWALRMGVESFLKWRRLSYTDQRMVWVRATEKNARTIVGILQQPHAEPRQFAGLSERMDKDTDAKAFSRVGILCSLSQKPSFSQEDRELFEFLGKNLNPGQTKELFHRILEILPPEWIRRERLRRPSRKMPPTPPAPPVKEDPVETVTVLQTSLDHAEKKVQQLQEESEQRAKFRFFSELHHFQGANLLDQLANADQTLSALSQEEESLPEELDSLRISLKLFQKFLLQSGVEAIHATGEQLQLDAIASEQVEYTGSGFEDGEKKSVKVMRGGWRVDGQVITPPYVMEIVEPEKED